MTFASNHCRWAIVLVAPWALATAGCMGSLNPPPPPGMVQVGPDGVPLQFQTVLQNNPVFLPIQDPNLLWDQLIDVVDDYFEVEREDRVRLVGDILTEGRLSTFPRGASTIFEPWNRDSVTSEERWQATLQSMRRTGLIRVIPTEGGFLVEVVVNKELEDVAKPDAVFVGNESLRNDNSIRRFSNNANGGGESLGWIPKGRDLALEQEIILQLQARFSGPVGDQVPVYLGENPPAQPLPTARWKPSGTPTTTR